MAGPTTEVDVAVIGGGIVGLATAHQLLTAHPDLEVAVLEAADAVGQQQSARNSGVLHAGLYYTPGSAKARWSRAGRPLPERARTNGVEIHRLGPDGLRDHEPHVAGVAGLWTPETAVTDFRSVCLALADAVGHAGGEIRTSTEVADLQARGQQVEVTSARGHELTARAVVVCGGLQADRLLATSMTG